MPVVFAILSLALAVSPDGTAGMHSAAMKVPDAGGPDQQVERLLIEPDLKLVQIILRNGKTMDRHAAPEPATIHCVSGSGVLIDDDGKEISLKPGVIVVLPAGMQHVVKAQPELSLLVTRIGAAAAPAR